MELFGYVRTSTSKREQKSSVKNQYQRLIDLEVPEGHIFADIGVSGFKNIKRRGFEACLDACRAAAQSGDAVTLYVSNNKRFGRLAAEGMLLLRDLENEGVQVFDLLSGTPLSVLGDRFIETGIKMLLAQEESERLKREIKRNYELRRSQGKPMGGSAIWGYRRSEDKSKLEVIEELREPLRQLIQWATEGHSLQQIGRWVGDGLLGVDLPRRPHARRKYDGERIADWLRHPAVRGHTEYRQDGILIETRYGTHEALMSEDEWRIIQRRFQQNKENRHRWKNRKQPLSKTYVKCGLCGGPTKIVLSSSSGRRFARCVNVTDCEHGQGTEVNVIIAAIDKALNEKASNIAKVLMKPKADEVKQQRIISLERKRDELRAFLKQHPDLSGIQTDLASVESELRSIRNEMTVQQPVDLDQYREMLEIFKEPDIMDEATVDERWQVYKALIERVEILDGGVKSVTTIWG